MAYHPQPGTVAYRAIEWMKRQPAGTEVTASVWAEAIGTDGNTLAISMKPALHAGVVRRCTKDGSSRPFYFSLGDGRPVSRAEEDEDDVLPVRTKAGDVTPRAGELLPGVRTDTPMPQDVPPLPLKVPKFNGYVPPVPTQAPAPQHELRLSVDDYIARIGRDEDVHTDTPASHLPFNACRYVDGSLVAVGVQVRDDGAVVFSPQQIASIVRLYAGTATC